MSHGLRARISIGLLSVAGTSAGHFLSYWVAAPDNHHRDDLLAATGHGGESTFVVLAVAALMATCIAVLTGRCRGGAPRFVPTVGTLALLQTAAFVGLESVERATVGVPLLEAAHESVFMLGLAAQLLIAVLGALIIRSLHVASATIAARPPLPSFIGYIELAAASDAPPTGAHRPWDARGPPYSSRP